MSPLGFEHVNMLGRYAFILPDGIARGELRPLRDPATPQTRAELQFRFRCYRNPGFWKALDEVSPATRHQRCTVHKTADVPDRMPRSVQPAARPDLRGIWSAPDHATAEAAVATFAGKYGTKYDKAVTCLARDRDALLTFHDVPAEHWDHLRTSNPIESVFATVRHRTVRTKGALSQDTARLMVSRPVMAAANTCAG